MGTIYINLYNWGSGCSRLHQALCNEKPQDLVWPGADFDLAEGVNTHQRLCNTLIYGRGKGGTYPKWINEVFRSWKVALGAGKNLFISFRPREIAKSLMALNSVFSHAQELSGANIKWIISLGRQDFVLEECHRVYPEIKTEKVKKSILDAGSYVNFRSRLERIVSEGNYLLLFPQLAPWEDNSVELSTNFSEILSFLGRKSQIPQWNPFTWRSAVIRRMSSTINNSWKKPSPESMERELSEFEKACPCPAGLVAQHDEMYRFAHNSSADWEKASGQKWLDIPLPAQMDIVSSFAGLASIAPETSEYLAGNVRLMPEEWQKPARAILEEGGAHIPESPEMAVLTLAFNHEDYIGQCVESVAAQERDFSLEHIIVDDISSDGTREEIARLAEKYPHVRPVFLENRRRGQNILAMFRECGSRYAALCDGDDYFSDTRKLKIQHDFLEENRDCAMCAHPVDVRFENGIHEDFIYPTPGLMKETSDGKYCLEDLFGGNFAQTNSVVYRWRFADGVPHWFRPDLCPGDWYWHLLHAEMGKIGFLPEKMAVYRRHDKALYAHAFVSSINHRKNHGMQELATYQAVNEHFRGKYFDCLSSLANGVMADFLWLQIKDGDESPMTEACEKFPEFAIAFIKSLEVTRKRQE